MITKKTKKTNSKKATKKQGYDLNNIATKKAATPKRGNGLLNLFFSLIGFVVVIGGLATMFVPTEAKADTITKRGNGTFIVEDFDCKVALANYAELQRSVKENNPKFVQEQLEPSLKLTLEALAEHTECEVQNGK